MNPSFLIRAGRAASDVLGYMVIFVVCGAAAGAASLATGLPLPFTG